MKLRWPFSLPTAPASTTGQPDTPFQLQTHYCAFCQQTALHEVLEIIHPLPDPLTNQISWLLKCPHCQAFSLQ
jgi:hypothetical protein